MNATEPKLRSWLTTYCFSTHKCPSAWKTYRRHFLVIPIEVSSGYLRSIVAFLKNLNIHMVQLRQVLTFLQNSEVTVNLKICSFLTEKTVYLGYNIQNEQLELSEEKDAAALELEKLITHTEWGSFFRPSHVFSRIAWKFSKLTSEMNKKLPKDHPTSFLFLIAARMDTAENPNERLTDPSILALWLATGLLKIDTYAYDCQVGCVFIEQQDGYNFGPVE